jgi:hypothetical protein
MAYHALLKDYLEQCFTVLYRFDVIIRECGINFLWEEKIIERIGYIWPDVEIESYESAPNTWRRRFV